jgi:alpha-amylase
VCIREANGEVYAATIDEKLAMRIGPGAWEPPKASLDGSPQAWRLAVSGPGFAVWDIA